MGATPRYDGGTFGHARIALAQSEALALGQCDQFLDRAMDQPCVGRMRNRLSLALIARPLRDCACV
jgi:hypothetical protein